MRSLERHCLKFLTASVLTLLFAIMFESYILPFYPPGSGANCHELFVLDCFIFNTTDGNTAISASVCTPGTQLPNITVNQFVWCSG